MREFCENFLIFPCVRCPLIGRPLVSSSSSRTNGRLIWVLLVLGMCKNCNTQETWKV